MRDRIAQDARDDIGIRGRIEIQPGALGSPFQQLLSLAAAINTLTDQA